MSTVKELIVPIGGNRISSGRVLKIIKVIKKVWKIVSIIVKTGGDTDSINNNSSIENIDRIIEMFSGVKVQMHQRSSEIEKVVIEDVRFYIEELKQILEDSQEIADQYDIRISRMEHTIEQSLPHFIGIIEHEIAKKVSLDNDECRSIMKMIPGEKKEKALQEFFNRSIRDALDFYSMNVKKILNEIYEDINREIIEKIDIVRKNSEVQLKLLEEIDVDNFIETVGQTMSRAHYLVGICTIVDDIL